MKKILFVVLLFIAFTSCKKYLNVNTTPNNPTSVPPSTILPTTTIGLAFANSNDLDRATSALVQHIAGVANQTQAYDIYNLDGAFDNQWNGKFFDVNAPSGETFAFNSVSYFDLHAGVNYAYFASDSARSTRAAESRRSGRAPFWAANGTGRCNEWQFSPMGLPGMTSGL